MRMTPTTASVRLATYILRYVRRPERTVEMYRPGWEPPEPHPEQVNSFALELDAWRESWHK
jgi:hypothetical protein